MEQRMNRAQLLERIVADPAVQHGQPCIRGTRTPVHVIVETIALGATFDEVKRQYPPLIDDDISAALLYAARTTNEEISTLAAQPA